MTLSQCTAEYALAGYWRDGWTRLSTKFEPGQLSSRRDRIAHRARIASSRVRRALQELDAQHQAQESGADAMKSPVALDGQPSAQHLVVQRLPDINNVQDARTVYRYEGAVRFEIEVAQPRSSTGRNMKPFEARASWGSRQNLTMAETNDFLAHLAEAMRQANADVEVRNQALTSPRR